MATPLRMQPMFTVALPVDPDEAMRRVRAAIATDELKAHAVAAGHVVDFKIEPEQRRFWSPHLSAQFNPVDDENGGDQPSKRCEAYCRFSPRPEIWTMFMAMYFAAACFIFAAAIWGYVQWFMGDRPVALLVIPVCLGIIVALHVGSLIGQGFSADQMLVLRSRFDRAIELAFTPEPDSSAIPPESVGSGI